MKAKYTFGVIVAFQDAWRNWVSEKASVSHKGNYQISTNRFTLRDIEYVKISNIEDIRGYRFNAIIDLVEPRHVPSDYKRILDTLHYCFIEK